MLEAVLLAASILIQSQTPSSPAQINLNSLLDEMIDRERLARLPNPAYTCKQFSSYDRASKSSNDGKTWFANNDVNQYLRVETNSDRKEWVMADMDGPGAVVRIWSANPKGTMRVYLDGATKPVIEASMADVLGGKWKVRQPLSGVQARGWNLFLPIPYSKHCTITSDADGFYYQVNYRTYAPGTQVESLRDIEGLETDIARVGFTLTTPRGVPEIDGTPTPLPAGSTTTIFERNGPGELTSLAMHFFAASRPEALRSTVLVGEFDGEQTIWCPLSDFFGSGVGINAFQDWYRSVQTPTAMRCDWVMPYSKSAKLSLVNLGTKSCGVLVAATDSALPDGAPTSTLMHFHADWHAQFPIHASAGRGTMDWNYISATGKGVYVGDSLAVMNPVEAWWGEGDEKIYVDGEAFPSHFGTGTEDYYGYAWCDPHVFTHPFHAQPRADGNGKNNWGHTTVSRVRSLDAIPFNTSLTFDMEIWHWAECDVAYAATTYWYAFPGATCNREPQPDAARAAIPQPPPPPKPMVISGAIECENLKVVGKSPGLTVGGQEMGGFAKQTWSGDSHLWVQSRAIGDYVELEVHVPAGHIEPQRIVLHASKSWDYGIVRFTINGQPAGPENGSPIDLCSGAHRVVAAKPVELGIFTPRADGTFLLRAEVVGQNAKAEGTKSMFGLDCLVLSQAKQ